MKKALLNCDVGEGMGNDEQLMPFIQYANIACGYHAGNVNTMQETIQLCKLYNVAIGAHPSFLDRENFGRIEKTIPVHELYELVTQQLLLFNEVVNAMDARLHHVKPHGALYNLSARDPLTAHIVARAVRDFNSDLVLVGLSGSHSITEAQKLGLKTANESFADRTYGDDGQLTPRSRPDATINNTIEMMKQVFQLVNEGTVTTTTGNIFPIATDTICLHGDGAYAVEFAKSIFAIL